MSKLLKRPLKFDWPLFGIVTTLVTIGVIMIFSTSSVAGFAVFDDSFYYIKRHLIYLAIGIVAFVIGASIPYTWYRKYALSGLIVSTGLIILTFLPGIGFKAGGAYRWLDFGIIQLQPVEVLKFFVVVFLATSLENKQSILSDFMKGVVPIVAVLMIPIIFLAKQPDLGNIILTLGVTFTLLLLSRVKLYQMLAIIGSGIALVVGNILLHPYQMDRIKSFLDPWSDPLGKSYHIIQSFIAVGSGGIFGLGIGQSKLKYFYLPLHYSDFIFSIICEEGGFILATTVILLFAALFHRGLTIGRKAKELYGFYLAIGLTLYMVYQAFFNIGVVVGIFPTKGIPLTFISYGGTSLIMSLFFVGVVMNVSRLSSKE